jgi:hypothetical protein
MDCANRDADRVKGAVLRGHFENMNILLKDGKNLQESLVA